ncbi:hypothetical protein E0Z10_g664 [Xylaria hypoxylon]|uniref:Uncharacterized protein n=1 Tax=Xylaria hypoxylon TaxID=37992 RepID=A0A4Z0ZGP3_9PEZI|nr:hypothetical protein E0Z10_g664 [Xylaria hypoxylon]
MDNQFDPAYSFMSLHTDGSSASGSFSAASTTGSLPDPFTPSSGRSTPVFLNMPMDHDNAACGILEIGPTPPASDFGPFLTQNMKPEASHYMGPGPNPYNHEMATPPMDYQPAPYAPEIFNFNTLPSNTTPPWSWPPEDGPVMFFGGDQPRMFGEAYPTLSYQAVLERATALHRVQGQPRISRRNRQTQVVMPNDIKTIVHPSGLFKCHHQKCGSKKPFKRAEHLKRHLNT